MTLDEVECQEDFDELLAIYQSSNADNEIKEDAIKRLRSTYPEFDNSCSYAGSKAVHDEIRAGSAEIPRGTD